MLEFLIHNLCFEQKYKKYQDFLSESFHFLVVKFSVYLNRHVFVMQSTIVISNSLILNYRLSRSENLVSDLT